MELIILKIFLFVIPFVAYSICLKSKATNYLEEIKAKNILKIIVTTVMLICILIVSLMVSSNINDKNKYLVIYFLIFRCLYEILVPMMRRFTKTVKGKKEDNKKFLYYDSIFFPCFYSTVASGLVFTILQVINISSFMMVYLDIGRMMMLSLIVYFLFSVLRCEIEDRGIDLKKFNLIDTIYIYLHGVTWVVKQPIFDFYIIFLAILYFVGF